jgi:hypothetical protein
MLTVLLLLGYAVALSVRVRVLHLAGRQGDQSARAALTPNPQGGKGL